MELDDYLWPEQDEPEPRKHLPLAIGIWTFCLVEWFIVWLVFLR